MLWSLQKCRPFDFTAPWMQNLQFLPCTGRLTLLPIALGLWSRKTKVCLATPALYFHWLIQIVHWNKLALSRSLNRSTKYPTKIIKIAAWVNKISYQNHKYCSISHHNKMFIAVSNFLWKVPSRPLHVTWLFSRTNLARHKFLLWCFRNTGKFSHRLLKSCHSIFDIDQRILSNNIWESQENILLRQDRCSFW